MQISAAQLFGYILGGMIMIGIIIIVIIWIRFLLAERLLKTEAKNKERLILLEKSADPSLLYNLRNTKDQSPLLWGTLLAGMGLGVLIGYVIHVITGWSTYVMTNSMVFLFGGLGLMGYYFYARKTYEKKTR